MNYGSAAYGSTVYGGAAASEWFVFFPFPVGSFYPSDVLHEARVEFGGEDEWFSIKVIQNTESGDGVIYKAYTSNDPAETPQLQVTFAGIGTIVIGAARFITVTGLIDSAVWGSGIQFGIQGRAGD